MRGWKTFAKSGEFHFGFRRPDVDAIEPPNPKQKFAIHALFSGAVDWLFFGGAAGGGKTSLLAYVLVRICLTVPRIQVAIFRRTHKDLHQSVQIEFFNMIPPGVAIFNGDLMRWEFANGALLWLCYCHHERDVYRYQSAQFAVIAIDEASHFTEFIVRYLVTRMRSPIRNAPKWLLLGSNPGGPGHGFLKRWFLRPTAEELGTRPLPASFDAWQPLVPSWLKGKVKPEQMARRMFVPAKLADNQVLQEVDPNYLANLYQVGGDTAAQLAEGDWDANEAMIVGRQWAESHVVVPTDTALFGLGLRVGQLIPWHVLPDPSWRPPTGAPIFGSVDYGYGAPWSFHLHAGVVEHVRTFHERYRAKKRDHEQATIIRQDIERLMLPPSRGGCSMEKPTWIVMDPSMWNSRKESGLAKSIAEVYEDELRPLGILLVPGAAGRSARVSRPQRWMGALSPAADGLPFWSVTTACPDLIRTVPDVPWDPDDTEVEDDDSENHCLAAGTLVETDTGPVQIEMIKPGDRVLTRQGYRLVERAWMTQPNADVLEVACSDGRTLRGAGHHPVWVNGRGFVRLDALAPGDPLTDAGQFLKWKPQPSSQAPSRSGEGSGTTRAESTSPTSNTAVSTCASTSTPTAPFRPGATSTTRTATARITPPATLRRSRRGSILASTAQARPSGNERRGARILAWLKQLAWRNLKPFRSSVPSAATGGSGRSGTSQSSTARPSVEDDTKIGSVFLFAVRGAWSIARSRVRAVESSSQLAAPASASAATLRVTTVRPSGRAATYDLSVADVHEFFANGILVSNCYEDTGRFFEARPFTMARPEADPYRGLDALSRAHQVALDAKDRGRGSNVFGRGGLSFGGR